LFFFSSFSLKINSFAFDSSSMLSTKQNPAIVRVNRFSLQQKPKRLLIHSKSVNCPIVHVKAENQSKNANDRSSIDSSIPLRTPSPSTSSVSLKNTEINTVENEKCLTEYCCYVAITCIIGWLLFLAVIMALVFICNFFFKNNINSNLYLFVLFSNRTTYYNNDNE